MLLGQGRSPKWFVQYPDGKKTVPMNKKTAKDYAKMFGGKVLRVVEGEKK